MPFRTGARSLSRFGAGLWGGAHRHVITITRDEIRTAYQVARLGTVSGAAEVLGVHHATVIRHIDALEGRLGAKLFFNGMRAATRPPRQGRTC